MDRIFVRIVFDHELIRSAGFHSCHGGCWIVCISPYGEALESLYHLRMAWRPVPLFITALDSGTLTWNASLSLNLVLSIGEKEYARHKQCITSVKVTV